MMLAADRRVVEEAREASEMPSERPPLGAPLLRLWSDSEPVRGSDSDSASALLGAVFVRWRLERAPRGTAGAAPRGDGGIADAATATKLPVELQCRAKIDCRRGTPLHQAAAGHADVGTGNMCNSSILGHQTGSTGASRSDKATYRGYWWTRNGGGRAALMALTARPPAPVGPRP